MWTWTSLILIALGVAVLYLLVVNLLPKTFLGKRYLKRMLVEHGIDSWSLPEPCIEEFVDEAIRYAKSVSSFRRSPIIPKQYFNIELQRKLDVDAFGIAHLLSGKAPHNKFVEQEAILRKYGKFDDVVPEPISCNFVPAILIRKCTVLVRTLHAKWGLDGLPKKVATSDYLPVLAFFYSDTFARMRVVSKCFKLKMASWVATLLCLVLSVVWSSWLLIGAAFGSVAAMVLGRKERDGWMYCASILLGLEILATDFFGWGTAYPHLRDKALWLLNDDPTHPKTIWLDFYLPQRATLDVDTLRGFWAPSGPT